MKSVAFLYFRSKGAELHFDSLGTHSSRKYERIPKEGIACGSLLFLCQPVLFGDHAVVAVDLYLIADLQRALLCQNVAVVDLILMCKVDLVFILIREDEE